MIPAQSHLFSLILKGLVGRQFSQKIGTLIVPRGKTQLVRKGMKAATYLP